MAQNPGNLSHGRRPRQQPSPAADANPAHRVAGLASMLVKKGSRGNAVAPGPVWTPLIPSTMPPDKAESFGEETPLGRAGQPADLAGAYVLLASDEGSYMAGAVIPVTGGRPML